MRFQGQSCIVTGGAGGLGSAIVRALVAEGARVVVADLDLDAARALAAQVGDAAIPARLDVSVEADWETLLGRIGQEHGGLDLLVNNAGWYCPNIAFEDMPLETWRQHFAVNSDGTFLGCKHAIRSMKARRRGAIVNIASGLGVRPSPTASAYCASKAAVLMTTRTAAAAGGPFGIRVNAVLPGAVPTAMLRGNLRPGQDEQAYYRELAQRAALGTLATAQDIARAVLYLADPANAAVTGVALPVDAGQL
jgi:NAD(P)-dependent dehydrogenase (short-subunit alcohol dehydrogenase family)